MNTVFENGKFSKLIFFYSEIAQYKEAVLTKSDKAKIKEKEKEEQKRKKELLKGYVRYLTLNSMTKNNLEYGREKKSPSHIPEVTDLPQG